MVFMRVEDVAVSPVKSPELPIPQRSQQHVKARLWLVVCLLFALFVRLWLVIYTHGVIDGDMALVGIQAQHILHGEFPIYFYGQPYMGSLEAYLTALLFAVAGPSVWTFRAEPILLSLIIVWLTWMLAGALANAARLQAYARLWFVTTAALFAALPPLYDVVMELRTLGGYIETFVLMLLLLLAALRLTQRWQAGASAFEMIGRWAGIGFIIGLGMWVLPLIIMAVLAGMVWIIGYCIVSIGRAWRRGAMELRSTMYSLFNGLVLSIVTIPASLLGFVPALYWGASHHWENITYMLNNGGTASEDNRLVTIGKVAQFYGSCIAPRLIGGAVPTESGVTAAHPHLFTLGLVVGAICLAVISMLVILSFFWYRPLLLQARQLAGLPLLFAVCSACVFCVSSISTGGLINLCGQRDLVGRYATPLLLSLPFLYATVFTVIATFIHERFAWKSLGVRKGARLLSMPTARIARSSLFSRILQWDLVWIVLLCLYAQGYTYIHANPGYLFQTSGCIIAPADTRPITAYLEHEHIRYAWASGWLGNSLTFDTDNNTIVVDPRMIVPQGVSIDRLPAYTSAVLHADRPSVLLLVLHTDKHPPLLQTLDTEHITYKTARFPSEPGIDVLVVTPLNRSIAPLELLNLGILFGHC